MTKGKKLSLTELKRFHVIHQEIDIEKLPEMIEKIKSEEKILLASVKKEIGTKIKNEREKQGFSLYKLARMCNMSQTLLGNIESGDTSYTIDSLIKISDVLKLKLL